MNAMISPRTVHSDHTPPNQCNTTVYHSNDVGKKMKPRTGQSEEVNSPSNHVVVIQTTRMAIRGASNASNPSNNGMTVSPVDYRDPKRVASSA